MANIHSQQQFNNLPSTMDESTFVTTFGGVYEHSPWVAQRTFHKGIAGQHDVVGELALAMAETIAQAKQAELLELINAHPDLAGKAALRGELTADSNNEQSSAGLDQCSAEELARFHALNTQYKEKFGFPFILAVRGRDRYGILSAFEERVKNSPEQEFITAIAEINTIAALRLEQMSLSSSTPSVSLSYPRNMLGYGETVPQAQWPNKAKIAVQFVVNYEEGGENCILHGDVASEAFLSEIVGAQPIAGARHMNMESIYEYGSRSGFWRLHRLFTERQLPVTVFGVAMALERNPNAVEAMLKADWEIASHGYRWIDYQHVPEHIEIEHLEKAIEIHERATGAKPEGWYLGRTSPNSHRLAGQLGSFLYNADTYADDLPYWDYQHNCTQLMVPYTLDANDMRFASPQGFNSGDQFFNYLKDSFDVLYAEGDYAPKMLSIGLHCRLVGRPGRAASLARFLDYVMQHDNVWITRRSDIARHWRNTFPAKAQ